MARGTTIAVLLLAALLEAGGDAIIRSGLRTSAPFWRMVLLACGGMVLFAYGCTVNTPPWDFGRLLGLYVVFFFVMAQAISWLGFRQVPSMSVLAGGALIVAGGLVIAFGKR